MQLTAAPDDASLHPGYALGAGLKRRRRYPSSEAVGRGTIELVELGIVDAAIVQCLGTIGVILQILSIGGGRGRDHPATRCGRHGGQELTSAFRDGAPPARRWQGLPADRQGLGAPPRRP